MTELSVVTSASIAWKGPSFAVATRSLLVVGIWAGYTTSLRATCYDGERRSGQRLMVVG